MSIKQNLTISEETIESIRKISYFRESFYRDLNIFGTIDFFMRRHVQPLSKIFDISNCIAMDGGAGFGWFSIAYLLAGGRGVVAVEPDRERLEAAKKIATVFSVVDKMEFIVSPIQNIPNMSNTIDLFVSIETMEHVGKNNIVPAFKRMKEIATQGILLTTPNKFFPVVVHDTRLPFIHWLPPARRKKYARLFGREKLDEGNDFISPSDIGILLDKFQPTSTCLTFQSFKDYQDHFPFYLPYGSNEKSRVVQRPSRGQSLYYRIASAALGRHSYWIMPSLAHIFTLRNKAV